MRSGRWAAPLVAGDGLVAAYLERYRIVTLDVISVMRYYLNMIKSFADKETEKIFRRKLSKRLPWNIQRKGRMKLEILDAAEMLQDLTIPPGNQLEKMLGDRKGQHSIRINEQWRICFVWQSGDAYDVEIVDYHKG
jgi:proteic killer suppression protein